MSKTYVIGVDGGGTKTLGILMDETETELARVSMPSSNIHAIAHSTVEEILQSLVTSLCEQGKIEPEDLQAICLGMAGCDSPKDREVLESFLLPILRSDVQLTIVNDAVVAMRAVLGKMHGILLIAGTGSICFGWNENTGEQARSGGWGHLLADEGSGYMIGLEGLRAILQGVDGRGAETSLLPVIFEKLGYDVSEPRSLIQFVYGEKGTKANIANLARYVFQEAVSGDCASIRIVEAQAKELARTIPPVFEKLYKNESGLIPIGLWGGNLVNVEIYREAFLKELNSFNLPLDVIIDAKADAVIGAAKHALFTLAEK
ncbi:MAG: N-acetylglucosamine kinase [Sumerlaeia bacterium]